MSASTREGASVTKNGGRKVTTTTRCHPTITSGAWRHLGPSGPRCGDRPHTHRGQETFSQGSLAHVSIRGLNAHRSNPEIHTRKIHVYAKVCALLAGPLIPWLTRASQGRPRENCGHSPGFPQATPPRCSPWGHLPRQEDSRAGHSGTWLLPLCSARAAAPAVSLLTWYPQIFHGRAQLCEAQRDIFLPASGSLQALHPAWGLQVPLLSPGDGGARLPGSSPQTSSLRSLPITITRSE